MLESAIRPDGVCMVTVQETRQPRAGLPCLQYAELLFAACNWNGVGVV